MPYYREQLLSAWSNSHVYEVGDLPPKLDAMVMKGTQQNEIGFWAPNPRKGQRNVVEKKRASEVSGNALAAPKFLSEKARTVEQQAEQDKEVEDLQDQLAETLFSNATKTDVPIMYRNVEIKYSRFGVDDFDFQCVHISTLCSVLMVWIDSTIGQSFQALRHILPTPTQILSFNSSNSYLCFEI